MRYSKIYFNKLVLLLCIVFVTTSYAQELPPITIYEPQQYGAENQNWDIAQSQEKEMYIANNRGLLHFNGAKWQLYNTPNETIMRSVTVVEDKIYTGCYMEFGFWQENVYGVLEYTSLSQGIKEQLIEDEQFWQIISHDDWVVFQSLNRVYIYNSKDKTFKIIDSEATIVKMFKVDESIYFQKANKGLFKIENGNAKLVTDNKIVLNNTIVDIYQEDRGLVVLTSDNGFFILNNNTLTPWNTYLNTNKSKVSLYSSIKLKDNNYVLGTISDGILYLNNDGELIYQISQKNGLSNNTVLSLFEDDESNLWLGLDNGINCLNMESPLVIYNDYNGVLGTVYSASVFNNNLYLGTNQGLFYKPMHSSQEFSFIEGTQGQVWCLNRVGSSLFCGHNTGTFLVTDGTVKKIANIQGTWSVKPIEGYQNLALQGNYSGLSVLEKDGDTWKLRNKIEGFDISSRFFELINKNQIIVNHEYKGVYKLKIDNDFRAINKIEKDAIEKGLNSSIFKYNNTIYYAYKSGVFKYDTAKNSFVKDSILSQIYNEDNYVSGKMVKDFKSNKLWCFSKTDLSFVSPGKLNSIPEITKIPLPNVLRKGMANYENVLFLEDEKYLFGTSSGYAIIDLNQIKEKIHKIKINSIVNSSIGKKPEFVDKSIVRNFESTYNNFTFSYSIPEYDKSQDVLYQYQLEGMYNNWTEWSNENEILFKNLPSGEYVFNIRAKVGNSVTEKASYSFSIDKPWYLSKIMIALYVLLFLLVLFIWHSVSKRNFQRKERELLIKNKKEIELVELENQKRLIGLENEKLQQDVENKNRELAISTMSLIKKNEFLNGIKKELNTSESNTKLTSVIKTIDKNINNTDDWKFFQEAFNNADKDFLKKVKTIHPSLTPNDLKLCAYLRLNLSSKEIAPLLNISSRSVEVKRYRLRKKMDLQHEESLTNYILGI